MSLRSPKLWLNPETRCVEPITKLFDRKTFNPDTNREDWKRIGVLRTRGFSRAGSFRIAYEEKFKGCPPNKFFGLRSTAYDYAMFHKGTIFLDAGAGHSADCSIAMLDGYEEAYSVDLFPAPGQLAKKLGVTPIKADICEKLPIRSRSVDTIICQAVLPLMSKDDRKLFYKNAHRLLKKGGILSVYFCKLVGGHPYSVVGEREECTKLGFWIDRKFTNGFVLIKK